MKTPKMMTVQTLFLAFLSLSEAWTIMKMKGKMTPDRKTRMQPNW